MKKLLLRAAGALIAVFALCTSVHAQHGGGGGGGGTTGPTNYPVSFSPVTEIASGDEPFTLSTVITTTPLVTSPGYYLQVTGPSDSTMSDYPMTVTFSISVLNVPAQATVDAALSYVNIYSADILGNYNVGFPGIPGIPGGGIPSLPGGIGASATLVFTGPNQIKSLYITEVIPLGVYAGNYLYQIAGTGWPSNSRINVVEYGSGNNPGHPTINSTVSVPATLTPPSVQITAPIDESKYFIYPYSSTLSPTVTIPITAEGNSIDPNHPVTGVTIYWGDTSTLLTNSTFTKNVHATGDAVATSFSPAISVPGTYLINAQASSQAGTSSWDTVAVNVYAVPPPPIQINGPANGAVFIIPVGSSTTTQPYTITGNGSYVADGSQFGVVSASATLVNNATGLPVAGFNPSFPGLPGSMHTVATGNLPALAAGTYTINAIDANSAGTSADTVTFTVIQAVPPTITISSPGNNSVYTTGLLGTATVPFTITGVTTNGASDVITGAAASLTSGGLPVLTFLPLFSGVGTSATTSSTGSIALLPGTYTMTAQDSNSFGGSANATPVTFTVVGPPTIGIAGISPTYSAGSNGLAVVNFSISGSTAVGTLFTGSSSAGATLTGPNGPVATFGPGFSVGLLGLSIGTGNTSISLPPGTYTMTATDINNLGGTATATPVTFTVYAPPAVVITGPVATYTAGSSGTVAVPYTVTGTTVTGTLFTGATGNTATLIASNGGTINGGAANGSLSLGGTGYAGFGSATIISAGSVTLGAGTYTIIASVTNSMGGTATAVPVTFTVTAPAPPTITISGVTDGSTVTIPVGSTQASLPYEVSGKTKYQTIQSASVLLNGVPAVLTADIIGLNTPNIVVDSTMTLVPGTYTLSATDNNGYASASAQVTFTVVAATGCTAPTMVNASNFNGTPISQGSTIWFNSVVNVSGLSGKAGTVQFTNSTVTFALGGSPVSVIAPSAFITFSATATSATTVYNAATNTWQTTVPVGYSGNVFLSGLAYLVPANFPAGLNPVTWSGSFLSNTQNVNVQWQWAAAVYTQFSSDLNTLGVKPIDASTGCNYLNSDHAGTPEAFLSFVTGGARGGGGSNYTGSYSGTVSTASTGTTGIPGLYPTGVSDSGALLAGGSLDPHYIVTASSMGSAYLGKPVVDLAPLAGGWVPNTSTSQWITAPGGVNIGNGGGKNGLPSSGSTAQTNTYDYTLTFTMPSGATPSSASITGTLSADDSVLIYVNGTKVTSNVPTATDYLYNSTASFKLTSANATFQAGTNTITFRVANQNTPTPVNASGFFVQSIGGTVILTQAQGGVAYCPSIDANQPPTIAISGPASTYTVASGGTVAVPYTVTGATPSGTTFVGATGNTAVVTASNGGTINGGAANGSLQLGGAAFTGFGSTGITATGSLTLTAGTYTISASDTNSGGLSATATPVTFTVVQIVPPVLPVITVTVTPASSLGSAATATDIGGGAAATAGTTITIPIGQTGATVPYAINGNLTDNGASGATLASASITSTLSGYRAPRISVPAASFAYSGSLSIPGPGTYSITATDANAAAVSASATITITAVQACLPTVAITGITDGSTITIPFGSTKATVPFTVSGGTILGNIISASILLNGSSVSLQSPWVLGQANITGSGTLQLAPGNYTLAATDANGYGSAAAQVKFTVVAAGTSTACCMVREFLDITGQGGIAGSIQMIAPYLGKNSDADVHIGGVGAYISGSLIVPGTPAIKLDGNAAIGVITLGTGASTPTTYGIKMDGQALVGTLVERVNPGAWPMLNPPPAPSGNQDVHVNSLYPGAINFAKMRDLALDGYAGTLAVPSGTYRDFMISGHSTLVLGVVGSLTPTVYNLQSLHVSAQATVKVVGPVTIVVANKVAIEGTVGSAANPDWLTLKVSNNDGDNSSEVDLSGQAVYCGDILVPTGEVQITGQATVNGCVTADELDISGQGLLNNTGD